MARAPCCLTWLSKRRLLAGGRANCWRGRTRMLSLLRWPTSWRALPAWSWRAVVSTTPATKRWPHRGEIARGVHSRRSEVCVR
jgi:hypothetical protein